MKCFCLPLGVLEVLFLPLGFGATVYIYIYIFHQKKSSNAKLWSFHVCKLNVWFFLQTKPHLLTFEKHLDYFMQFWFLQKIKQNFEQMIQIWTVWCFSVMTESVWRRALGAPSAWTWTFNQWCSRLKPRLILAEEGSMAIPGTGGSMCTSNLS